MDSLLAIGVGLVLRILLDTATDNDDRISGVLVGLWEGIVLNHFVRRMPRNSFDPYLGFGFRIFVDFLFTQSLSRLSLVALWALVGMLLADVAPNIWRDSGLRHLYRQVRKDVRHVKRAVPRIRIKNDLPSVRLFNRSRSTSSQVSGSVRSDRAAPSRSPAPSPAPTPGPSRRPARSPPGTFPNVSGWSETGTDVSSLRENIVTHPGPSPSLIPSQEFATYGRTDTISRTQNTTVQDTTITITQTQNKSISMETTVVETTMLGVAATTSMSLESANDPSRNDPPTIPDDWVDINHPTPAQANEPVAAFVPDPDSTPEPPSQPGPSSPTPSRAASIPVAPPAIEILSDIPDVDLSSRASQPPDQIPLPESRAASVIGGVYDQPQPRSALRDTLRSRVDKATSEIGMDPAKPLAPIVVTESTKSQTRRSWLTMGSTLKRTIEVDAPPKVPPKEPQREAVVQSKVDESAAVQSTEPLATTTPAQVDPPPSILTQPGDAPPLLFSTSGSDPEPTGRPSLIGDDANVDSSSTPPEGRADKGRSLFDMPSPTRSPPPPFTEFEGVPEGPVAGEAPAEQDPVTQDEGLAELNEEQKVAEEKRMAFLRIQVQELEGSRAELQKQLDKEDDPEGSSAKAIESDLEDSGKTLSGIKTRLAKKKFSGLVSDPLVPEISLVNRTVSEAQTMLASAILDLLLERDDAGPMTIQVVVNKQKSLKNKAKDTRDAVVAFAKRHQFMTQYELATPGIVNITF